MPEYDCLHVARTSTDSDCRYFRAGVDFPGGVQLAADTRSASRRRTLKNQLAKERAQHDARLEYEYHARQRLYEQYEPMRFQLLEAIETAKCQIETMSEQSLDHDFQRLGSTPKGNYWLLGTVYHLLHPAAVFRMAQRRLTLVDLRIDQAINIEYTLAKKAYLVLSHDARMADVASLRYTPYVDGWRQKRELNPSQFRRQGLPLGRLDNAIGTLLVKAGEAGERVATFGEFEAQFSDVAVEDVSGPAGAARDLFSGFNPTTKPVLWRLLLAQFVIYKALSVSIRRNEAALDVLVDPWRFVTTEERAALGLPTTLAATLPTPITDAAKYLQMHVIPDVQTIAGRDGLTLV